MIITILSSGKHELDVYADLVPSAQRGTLLLDCSTIDVADARAAAAENVVATVLGRCATDLYEQFVAQAGPVATSRRS